MESMDECEDDVIRRVVLASNPALALAAPQATAAELRARVDARGRPRSRAGTHGCGFRRWLQR